MGIAKNLGISLHDALYEISYQNAILYSRATPLPDDERESDAPRFDASKDANNPDLYTDLDDEEIVRI